MSSEKPDPEKYLSHFSSPRMVPYSWGIIQIIPPL
jgi:hypothetical protein